MTEEDRALWAEAFRAVKQARFTPDEIRIMAKRGPEFMLDVCRES